MGPSPDVPHLRPHRLLRQLHRQARYPPFREEPSPPHPELRARRGLGMVLPGGARDRARALGWARAMSGETAKGWPRLAMSEWKDTYASLHLWTQIVGKTRLALSPWENHWWHVALYLTARGIGTSPLPFSGGTLDIEFDFIDHALVFRTSGGTRRSLPLRAQPVCDFHEAYVALLRDLGVSARIHPKPCEIPDPILFTEDRVHAAYDPEAAHRFWTILRATDGVFKSFRGRFLGKSSPSHFWWGGFDLACTRFSGR